MKKKRCYGKHHTTQEDKMVPLDQFGKSVNQKDGLATICKKCRHLSTKEYRKDPNFLLKQKEASKQYYQKNKQDYIDRKRKSTSTDRGYRVKMLAQSRCRARDANLEFNLTLEDLIIPKRCPVLGIPLKFNITGNKNRGKGGKDNSPSLDRIDPTRGYVKDNIVVVSWRANRLKSDATTNEIIKLYEFYTVNHK